jgi:hypothetical protein
MKRDYSYDLELNSCDGSNSDIIASTSCTVPISSLTAAPFLMVPGEWVNVKIIAVNAYGESVFSNVGSGGKI